MSRLKKRKAKLSQPQGPADITNSTVQQKRFEWFAIAVLLFFGIYQSVLFFGYRVVPNSDFPAFVEVARKILSFDIPTNYKRLPGLGILQIALSNFVGGHHPVLTAGWLLNSILHPVTLILFYLIARKFIGKAAFWLVLVVAINPLTIELLSQPMAETTLLCFTLLAFYLILVRSNLCYVAACAATLIRYDAAVLIIAAMAMDIVENRNKKQILLAMAKGSLAFVPLAIWIIGTRLNWESSSKGHYLSHYTGSKHIGLGYLALLWKSAMGTLLQCPAWVKAIFLQKPSASGMESIKQANDILYGLSKLAAIAGFATGIMYSIIKKNLKALPLLVFLACNIAVHMVRMRSTPRYCFLLIWATMLMCCYGWGVLGRLINRDQRIPSKVLAVLYILIIITGLVWIYKLTPALGNAAKFSPGGKKLLIASIAAVVLFAMVSFFMNKKSGILRVSAITVFMCLIIFSNHYGVSKVIGNGLRDAEFKMLADWFVENSQPGEKLVTSLPKVVSLFAPDRKADIVHVSNIGGTTPQEFVASCYKKNITYVAWDSRIGLRPKDSYYKKWRIERIAPLINPKDNGPYQYVKRVGENKTMSINIFRLKKL
ncbi:MAG: hypothetical protein JW912_02230 [Sedimentisphaerales bacterium]|nr:hypothetical protein [Sedimentisphaerales bacterium]